MTKNSISATGWYPDAIKPVDLGASGPADLCCKEGLVRHRHTAMGASAPSGLTGLWNAFAFQCSNSSARMAGLRYFRFYPLRFTT
jgi:hypothetical protein